MVLTQWYPPEPVHKGAELARELVRRGHEVVVVTGFPNYPGGRLYDGYRMRLIRRETVDGVAIVRLPIYPSHDGSGLRRAINYGTFALSAAILSPWLVRRVDAAYVYHPPGTIGLPALSLRALRRVPFVVDIQDLWPDTLAATGMVSNSVVLSTVGAWMWLTYRFASHIIVLSPGFKSILMARGVRSEKITVVYNWSLGESYRGAVKSSGAEPAASPTFDVVFAGNMGKAQALDAVLDAARILADSHPKVRVVFVGDGVEGEGLRKRARSLKLTNTVFVPRPDSSQIGSVLESADALLVHLRSDPLFAVTIPSKTQAYLAAGRPIVMAVDGDAANLIENSGGGVVCESENPRSIAEAIGSLSEMTCDARDEMGRRGQAFYEQDLSISRGIQRIITILESVSSGRSRRLWRRRRERAAK